YDPVQSGLDHERELRYFLFLFQHNRLAREWVADPDPYLSVGPFWFYIAAGRGRFYQYGDAGCDSQSGGHGSACDPGPSRINSRDCQHQQLYVLARVQPTGGFQTGARSPLSSALYDKEQNQ